MKHDRLITALGVIALAAGCSSDSHSGPGADGGATGGTSGSGAAPSGGQPNTGGTASGSGGASTGGSGAGGSATGGASGASGSGGSAAGGSSGGAEAGSPPSGDGGLHIDHVFVIAMENHDQSQIVGDMADAPYINGTLLKNYASTSNFVDPLDISIPSEPHYVFMEAGTNAFSDVTFTGDADPSAQNSTASTDHLVTQMKNASTPVTWMSYQEGLDGATGACPVASSDLYAAKHDPFVFFQDVAGSPPSGTNTYCSDHHAAFTQLATDLSGGTVAAYSFITPNLCNDMHGAGGCPDSNTIRSGDDWLSTNLPPLIDYANANRGVIFIVWDEGAATLDIPFIAVGPKVKKGHVGTVHYTHGSLVKSVERIFGLPFLSTVAGENDLADLFEDGSFP
jgi:hypothetical protein